MTRKFPEHLSTEDAAYLARKLGRTPAEIQRAYDAAPAVDAMLKDALCAGPGSPGTAIILATGASPHTINAIRRVVYKALGANLGALLAASEAAINRDPAAFNAAICAALDAEVPDDFADLLGPERAEGAATVAREAARLCDLLGIEDPTEREGSES